ncbi:MAG TPA: sugar ABC transporter ATP-binding protein [Roseiarcus sp.]|jgi:ribose transport system ATP-binding protein|nr:sugar ABC transporter ATP-binding protein [Roseiarcus sp.]
MDLSIDHVTKDFPSVRALDDVTFRVRAGEIHALMGENGAGKSTLIKIVTGVYKPDSGRLLLDGQPAEFASPRDALAAAIGAVHQERNLIPRFSVGENIVLEHLPTRNGMVDYAEVHRQPRAYLDLLDRAIDTRAEVATLSVAQMQLVEIAKALSLKAKLLLLDEPTASISGYEAAALFDVLRRLRAQGVAIVFVSHKLEEVLWLCDRVTVLRDGKIAAADEPTASVSRGRLVSLMIGRDERVADMGVRNPDTSQTVLELKAVSTSFGHRDVDLSLHKGEILGLYGLVGAGRTELARSILGYGRITAGEIRVNGQLARIRSMNEALENYRIGYVSEDRKGEGLLLTYPVRDNIAITIWRCISGILGLITPGAEAKAAGPFVGRLAICAPSIDAAVSTLSGGNQQKVSIAKWLAAQTDILIVDEPTVGIDVKTKVEIHELIAGIARDGVSVLLITSDMAEMVTLADRILVLHDFRIVGEVASDHRYEGTSAAVMNFIHAVEPATAGA